MKKSSMLLITAALALSSCGTAATLASSDNGQKFQDGIYSSGPSFRSKEEKAEDKAATDALVEKTKASEIYLFGDKKDTVMVPENFAASIQYDKKLGSTIVTVSENPYDWRYSFMNHNGYYYDPYSIGSSWYWSRHYDPWYWDTWSYSHWRYSSWHYYSSWYDPWYYSGYWGFYDPWHYNGWYGYYHNPYYCGWYGGWYPHHHFGHFDPYPGHHHHHHHGGSVHVDHRKGHRYQTGSNRIIAGSSSSLRGGSSIRNTAGRNTSAVSSATATGRRVSSGISADRTAVNRTTATKVTGSTASRGTASTVSRSPAGSAGSKQAAGTGRTSSTYRRPSTVSSQQSNSSGNAPAYRRSPSMNSSSSTRSSGNSSGYERNSSSSRQSSPSYERSSSPSYNRSSSSSSGSGSSFSRSSSSSTGSYNRGGSSSGYRR